MPGHQEGHQLVAQLVVGERVPLLVARQQELAQDVLSLAQRGIGTALVDLPLQEAVDAGLQPDEPPPGAQKPEVVLHPGQHEPGAAHRQQPLQHPSELP